MGAAGCFPFCILLAGAGLPGVRARSLLPGNCGRQLFGVDNVDYPQSRGHAIVDIVDNLKSNCPHCPQIQKHLANNAGRGAKNLLIRVDNVDNLNCPRLLAPR
jgi:hypothetical protein